MANLVGIDLPSAEELVEPSDMELVADEAQSIGAEYRTLIGIGQSLKWDMIQNQDKGMDIQNLDIKLNPMLGIKDNRILDMKEEINKGIKHSPMQGMEDKK